MDSAQCSVILQQLAVLTARVEYVARLVARGSDEEMVRDREEWELLVQLRSVLSTISAAAATLSGAAASNLVAELISVVRSPLLAMMLVNFALSSSHWGRYLAGLFGLLADPLSTSAFFGLWAVIAAWQRVSAVWESCCGVLSGGERNVAPYQAAVSGLVLEQPPASSLFQRMRGYLPSFPGSALGVGALFEQGDAAGNDLPHVNRSFD